MLSDNCLILSYQSCQQQSSPLCLQIFYLPLRELNHSDLGIN